MENWKKWKKILNEKFEKMSSKERAKYLENSIRKIEKECGCKFKKADITPLDLSNILTSHKRSKAA